MSSNLNESYNENINESSPIREPISPSRNLLSTSKSSWCSSPFSNLVTLSPDSHSLTFSLADLSPSMAFSSPRNRFSSELTSPQSSTRLPKDIPSCSLFSPSLFSPFNKSLNPNKMDKYTDEYEPTSNPRLISGIEDTSDHLLFNQSNNILPRLLKSTDDKNDIPSQGNNLNLHGFDLEDISHQYHHNQDNNNNNNNSKKFNESIIPISSLISSTSIPLSSLSSNTSHSVDMKSPVNRIHLASNLELLSNNNSKNSNNINHISSNQQIHSNNYLNKESLSILNLQQINGNKIVSPPSQNMPFSSPAVTAKPKQPNMSPNMDFRSHCNCKKSKCLKLYCECFAALRYCSSCNCVECNNCKEYEIIRQEAIQLTRERNPAAFQMKVSVKKGHMAGCNCKKSRCLKKYCECFEGSVFCGPNCKCVECQNVAGSDALKQAKSSLNKEKRERSQRNDSNDSDDEKTEITLITNPKSILLSKTHSPEKLQKSYDEVTDTPFKIRSRSFINNDDKNNEIIDQNEIKKSESLPIVHKITMNNNNSNNNNPSSPHYSLESLSSKLSPTSSSCSILEIKSPSKSDKKSNLINNVHIKNTHNNSNSNSDSSSNCCYSDSINNSNGTGSDTSFGSPSSTTTFTNSSITSSPDASSSSTNDFNPTKKRRIENNINEIREPVYPFFGMLSPPTTKIIALSCLEYLDGPGLYAMSCVNHLWNQAVMDDALWE